MESLLDEIQRRVDPIQQQRRIEPPTRQQLKQELQRELSLLMRRREWGFALRRADILKTVAGRQDYPLPADFGANFALARKPRGSSYIDREAPRHMVQISDGSNERQLLFRPHGDFFSRDHVGASSSAPVEYTISRRRIWLWPPPDAAPSQGYYEVRGSYVPAEWKLSDDLPVADNLLLWAVLRRYDPQYDAFYREELAVLSASEGRSVKARITPRTGRTAGW